MNELALFAGAGGGILGGKLLGWRTVCAVEIEPYRAERLAQRQNEGFLSPFPIWCGDIAQFDGRPWRGIVDVVSVGFPCQDISAANPNAEGITGARSGLWKEAIRIIREVGPRFVLVENSPMLASRGMGVVLADLAEVGLDARWGVLGADDLGGYHRRDRLFIVANTREGRCGPAGQWEMEQPGRAEAERSNYVLANGGLLDGRAKHGKHLCKVSRARKQSRRRGNAVANDPKVGSEWGGSHPSRRIGHQVRLRDSLKLWPTITKSMVTGADLIQAQYAGDDPRRPTYAQAETLFGEMWSLSSARTESLGPLNPDFAEWLMGWPIGWTGSAPLEMDRFRQWLPQSFKC